MNKAQLKAWAIDRAIETVKGQSGVTSAVVIDIARQYVDYTYDAQDKAEDLAAEQNNASSEGNA